MWKSVLGSAGFVAGAVLAGAFVQFSPIWLVILAGLLLGTFGVLVGIAFEARAVTQQVILGLLGYFLGAVLGGFLVWYIMSFGDTFAAGGLAGIFVGIPIGALVGSAVGLAVGSRLAKTPFRLPVQVEPGAPSADGRDLGS